MERSKASIILGSLALLLLLFSHCSCEGIDWMMNEEYHQSTYSIQQLNEFSVQVNVSYSGSSTCPSSSCTNSSDEYFPYTCCANNVDYWNEGNRTFLDPVPPYNIVTNISALVFGTACNQTRSSIGITVDSNLLGSTNLATVCSCPNCVPLPPKEVASAVLSVENYKYDGTNTVEVLVLDETSNVCISNITLTISYEGAVPSVKNVAPISIPVNTDSEILFIGEQFLPYNVSCLFGDVAIPASYINSEFIACVAPAQSQAVTTSLELFVDNTTVDCGYFQYYDQPVLQSFYPTEGTWQGGFNVTVTGTGFFSNATDLTCKFGGPPVTAVYVNETAVICIDPKDYLNANGRNVTVGVAMNGLDFVYAPGQFEFLGQSAPASPSPSPSRTPSISTTSTKSATVSQSGKENLEYAWIAVAVGSLLLVFICILLCIFASNYWRKRQQGVYTIFPDETTGLIGSGTGPKVSFHNSKEILDAEANLIPIRELKNCKLLEKGSFGVIYQAQWRGTTIAVKKLPSAEMTDRQLKEFYAEAALMRSLRHPNILQYLGICNAGGEICILMEFMAKGSLYRLLHDPASGFDTSMIKSICLDTARGMNYLHQQKPPIVHRDLKSHNLLVDEHWRVKVCDFGLSRIAHQNATMTACGTPSWTAPEVLRSERYTTKADVYGFGVVVWEMFARADPFPGMPPFQIVYAVGNQGLRPNIEDSWPPEWISLITECWEEDANRRPTFEQILSKLESIDDVVL